MNKERLWYLARVNLLAAMKPDEMVMFNRMRPMFSTAQPLLFCTHSRDEPLVD